MPDVFWNSAAGVTGPTSSEGKGAQSVPSPWIGQRWVEVREVVIRLKRRRIYLPVNSGGNRQFRGYTPGVANKQTVALAVSVAIVCGIERHMRRIHLLQQKAGDWAAADPVETCFAAHKTKEARLTPDIPEKIVGEL